MMPWRFAAVLLAGSALGLAAGAPRVANAEDVTVNMDALGPAPAKKTTKPAAGPVASEIVPDPAPMKINAPKAAQPKLTPKPLPAPSNPQTAQPSNEIDFIGRTKRSQDAPENDKTEEPVKPVAAPPVVRTPTPPVMATPIPDEPPPVKAVAPAAPAIAITPAAAAAPAAPKAPAPKKTAPPANVVVNSGGLDGETSPDGKPKGTPLTSVQPDGVLYVPKNTNALPQPVSVPSAPEVDEAESNSLMLPPALPEAPPLPAPPVEPQAEVQPPVLPAPKPVATAPAAVAPAKMALKPPASQTPATAPQPPTTQAIAAVVPEAVASAAPQQVRASVLSGQATALQLTFEAGQDTLSPDARSALDPIAVTLKATGLRVQLAAYSGPPGNNSSDARRLSLKRALAVREYLSGMGVAAMTVNIAAFGGATEGQTDRVDVMVRTDQVGRLSTPQ